MKKTLSRRQLVSALVLSTLGVSAAPTAFAETYPDRPVRIMHGFAAGGNADAVARLVATALQQQLGQPFVVEPKSGAGGTLAGDAIAKSRPDGYNLLLATGGHAIAVAMHDRLPYDTEKAFQPISTLTSFSFLIAVQNTSPYRNLQDLLAAARAKPSVVTYGSAGIGTGQHMTGGMLAHKAGVSMLHVPYRGDAASVTALLGGEVDFVVAPPTAVVQHVRAGKLRALAISGNSRWAGLPEVPTAAEQGVRDFDVKSWTALLAPAGTPAPVVERLNAAVRTVLADAGIRLKLEELTGGEVRASSPKELGTLIQNDSKRWVDLVKEARIAKE